MIEFRAFTCCYCGGRVDLLPGKGRTRCLEAGIPLSIPDDFLLPTCRKCGEQYMCVEISGPLDALLARLYPPKKAL